MSITISSSLVLPNASDTLPPFPLCHARIGIDSICTRLNTSASTTAAGFLASNPATPWTNERWKPVSLPAWWMCDAGAGVTIDYIGIAGHNLGTTGTIITIEYSTDGTTWHQITSMIQSENTAIMLLMPTPIFARFFRLSLSGGSGIPEIGVVYIGEALAMQRCIGGSFTPYSMAYNTKIFGSMSEFGQVTSRSIRRQSVMAQFEWKNLTADWVRQYIKPVIKKMRYRPFFILWRPDLYPQEAGFIFTRDTNNAPSYQGQRNFMTWSLSGEGWCDE